ncbi:F-box/LRR-repeat protein [Rosa sericea]
MGSVSKHQAIVKDRISALPDAVLGHILSFLRTKYAVRTTILSKRWNKLWIYVPSLDFKDQQDFRTFRTDGYGSELFTNFVDRVLLFRQSSDIRKFSLSLRHCDAFSRIDGWICTAIRRNVVELDFFLCVDDDITFELPRCVFMCKTLEVLKLASNCLTCAPPPSGCFSSLKFLHVSVCYPVSDWVANIFSHCPLLEGLIIDGNIGLERVMNFNISACNLKTLKIDLYIDGNPGDPAYNLFIDAPKLENLDVKLDKLSNYYIEDAKSLIKADIDLEACGAEQQPAFANRVTALLALISSVKSLSLSQLIVWSCLFMNAIAGNGYWCFLKHCIIWKPLPYKIYGARVLK